MDELATRRATYLAEVRQRQVTVSDGEQTVDRATFVAHIRRLLAGETAVPCTAIFTGTTCIDKRASGGDDGDRGYCTYSVFPLPGEQCPTENDTSAGMRGWLIPLIAAGPDGELIDNVDYSVKLTLDWAEKHGPVLYIIGRKTDPLGTLREPDIWGVQG